MSVITETHHNKTIKIVDGKQLSIEGKPIPLIFDHDTGKWSCDLLPYTQYDDLITLARQVIDNSEEFKG